MKIACRGLHCLLLRIIDLIGMIVVTTIITSVTIEENVILFTIITLLAPLFSRKSPPLLYIKVLRLFLFFMKSRQKLNMVEENRRKKNTNGNN